MKKYFKELKDSMKLLFKTRMSPIFILLVVLATVSMLISNVVAIKNFPLFGWEVFGNELTLTAGVLVFPITYILSDVFSEVYGYRWSRLTSYIAFVMNLLMVAFFQLAIVLPFPEWRGDTQNAMASVLGNTPGMLFAGLIAYLFGDFFNDLVFKKLKEKHKDKKFGVRAIVSSFVGEITDSCIFLPLMYLFTNQYGTTITAWYQLVIMILIQASLKTAYEVVICPITYLITRGLKKYEKSISIE